MRRAIRRHVRRARELLFPPLEEQDPRIVTARRRAEGDWQDLFAPLSPLVADAAVLEIGCDDGALLAALLERPGDMARSAVGIEVDFDRLPQPGGALRQSYAALGERLELHDRADYLEAFDPESFDLLICRDVERVYPLEDLENGLRRMYELLRPGGEALAVVRAGRPDAAAPAGPGYGFLTPTTWLMLFLRAGFEIDGVRRVWRDAGDGAAMAALLPASSDEERMTREMRLRLIRPWEGGELDKVWAAKGG